MYTREKYNNNLDVSIIAGEVCEWSITRYGYFVNSSVDRLEMTKAFAEELSRLPRACLNYVDKAKNKWIDLAHKRPPTMPDFLQLLREFNNHALNERTAPRIENTESTTSLTAKRWDNAKTIEQKREFFRTFKPRDAAPATKWVMREFLRGQKVDCFKITKMLGKPF
jgi:hypothetical protein